MNLEMRLLDLDINNGWYNTALDQAILESVARGESPPTLVFTKWEPTVSIGNSQHYGLDVDQAACDKHRVAVVRRRSGGQSVYLDEDYLVINLFKKPEGYFLKNMDGLRENFSQVMLKTLEDNDIPVSFAPPDNIIVKNATGIKTLGNSGQILTKDAIMLQGSIRYALNHAPQLIDTLRINGNPLHQYTDQIGSILGHLTAYKPNISKEYLKGQLMHQITQSYNVLLKPGCLTTAEKNRIDILTHHSHISTQLEDRQSYKSRGVCYFFVHGKNLIPETQSLLPDTSPSNAQDSTITLNND